MFVWLCQREIQALKDQLGGAEFLLDELKRDYRDLKRQNENLERQVKVLSDELKNVDAQNRVVFDGLRLSAGVVSAEFERAMKTHDFLVKKLEAYCPMGEKSGSQVQRVQAEAKPGGGGGVGSWDGYDPNLPLPMGGR